MYHKNGKKNSKKYLDCSECRSILSNSQTKRYNIRPAVFTVLIVKRYQVHIRHATTVYHKISFMI